MNYLNYNELIMITITDITQAVSQYHMAKLNLFFLSRMSLSSCLVRIIGMGEYYMRKES